MSNQPETKPKNSDKQGKASANKEFFIDKHGVKREKATGRIAKGFTANENGKPEGSYSLLAILKKELQKCPEGQDKKTYGELIVRRMLKEAIEKGDVQQIKLIWNYIEGMPKESHDLTSSGEKIVFLPYEIITKHDINANPESNSAGQT